MDKKKGFFLGMSLCYVLAAANAFADSSSIKSFIDREGCRISYKLVNTQGNPSDSLREIDYSCTDGFSLYSKDGKTPQMFCNGKSCYSVDIFNEEWDGLVMRLESIRTDIEQYESELPENINKKPIIPKHDNPIFYKGRKFIVMR